jgi:YHS domain-containing protein
MTDVDTLIRRIDQELESAVNEQKTAWAESVRMNHGREARLQRYENVAQHIIELLKPRIDAFLDRFKSLATVEPSVREHTRAVNLTFASKLAKVTLTFEVFPDSGVDHVRLECTLGIFPAAVRYDRQSVLELPLEAVQDDVLIQWFDERIVAFVKAYITLVRQDFELQKNLKDLFVEDPVAKIHFPKYLAASTLEREGQTYYFLDEETRREFERKLAANH